MVYIAEDLEMPQFMITNVELEERTNIYNIGTILACDMQYSEGDSIDAEQ